MKIKRWMLAALAFSFLFIQGSVNAQQDRFVSQRNTAPESANMMPYWTPERMAAARPEPLVIKQGSPVQATDSAELRADGPAGATAGGGPGGAEVRSPISNKLAGTESPAANYFTYPFPFTRTEVFPTTLYTVYPWSTNGKLYFTKPGVGNFYCSASAVTSGSAPRRALVLTAGQCVSNGSGTFWTNFMFVPAARDAISPFGAWDWDFVTTTTEWHTNANFKRDVAFVITSKRISDGQSLGNVVGDIGFGWNQPDKQDLWAHGYPGKAPFNGKRMILCTAAIAARDSLAGVGPAPIGIGCDQNIGAGGGTWKRASTLNSAGYAIGLFSYKYTAQPLANYSPYFDTAIHDLWVYAQSLVSP